jgi:hypothetical protein
MMTRNQITAFLGLSIAYWVALLLWRGAPVSRDMLLPFSAVVGAVSLSLLVFDKWIWHWPIFRGWLVKRPRLQGTWRAELVSDWINPETGQAIAPIQAYMVVRQTASSLSLRLLTQESRSETVSSGIESCSDGTFEITCAYRNKPKAEYRHRSEVHYGSMLLVAEGAAPTRLEGEYWTDRKTTGSIVLTDRKKGACMTFSEAQKLFEA